MLLYKLMNSHEWMNEWPPLEKDAGSAVMKIPVTKVKALFKVVIQTPVATTLSISRAVDNNFALISVTYQSHRAGSVA